MINFFNNPTVPVSWPMSLLPWLFTKPLLLVSFSCWLLFSILVSVFHVVYVLYWDKLIQTLFSKHFYMTHRGMIKFLKNPLEQRVFSHTFESKLLDIILMQLFNLINLHVHCRWIVWLGTRCCFRWYNADTPNYQNVLLSVFCIHIDMNVRIGV